MTTFKENLKPNTAVKVLARCIPSITISPDALVKMQLFVDNCTDEVGWLGTAYKDEKNNSIFIDDMFLFDQEVHSTTTEITPEGLTKFAEAILEEPDGMEVWNNLKVWGHSHVNMSVSPSGQDESQMSTFADGGHDWFIRIIANKKGELRVDLYDYKTGVIYSELPWYEGTTGEELEIEEQIKALYMYLEAMKNKRIKTYEDDIKEEIKAKVKKKSYSNITYWNKGSVTDMDTKATTTTKTTTNESTQVTGGKKKESTSTKKASDVEEDRIETDIDVYHWFNYDDLLDIGFCESTMEVEEIMYQYGYYNIFDELELQIILKTAQAVCAHYYKTT